MAFGISCCHMTCVHKPNDDRIVLKECVSLLNAGYNVSLVYLGDLNEIIDKRINYVCAGKQLNSRQARMTIGVWKVFCYAVKLNAKIYHFHDPELIPIGIILKLLRKKVIYDVHEDFPKQILSKYWVPNKCRLFLSKIARLIEKLADTFLDGIVVVLPSIGENFKNINNVCLYNYPLKNELNSNVEWGNRELFFLYAGGLSKIRCVDEISDAIGKTEYELFLAGEFEDDETKKKILNKKNVVYKGYLNREEIKYLYSKAYCGLVLFYPVPNHMQAQPVKMKEYMAAGIPFIASNFPEWENFVKKYQCGICVNPLDISAISEAMKWMIHHPNEAKKMGENGKNVIESYYSWENEEKKLLELYKNISG